MYKYHKLWYGSYMTTTNVTPVIESFDDFKREFLKAFDKLADEYGRTRNEFAQDVINGLITSIMFGRAARKGNVAKSIYWGVSALQLSARSRSNRERADRKRERKEFSDLLT